ncbi:MAG: hypothetical protein Q4E24_15230 [bacterium]|nr:hypothetical protein [bacterium]
MKTIQISLKRLTVRIALGAVILAFISQFLPWMKTGNQSQSLIGIYTADTSFFAGVPMVLLLSLLWIAGWFLLNHPKLTLIGIVPLLFVWFGFLLIGGKYQASLGIGFFVYLIAVLTCAAMAFATKKIKTNTNSKRE